MEYARDDEHLCRVIIYNGHVTNSAFLHQKLLPYKKTRTTLDHRRASASSKSIYRESHFGHSFTSLIAV